MSPFPSNVPRYVASAPPLFDNEEESASPASMSLFSRRENDNPMSVRPRPLSPNETVRKRPLATIQTRPEYETLVDAAAAKYLLALPQCSILHSHKKRTEILSPPPVSKNRLYLCGSECHSHVQGDYVGFNTGNEDKLSNSPAAGLALHGCSLVSLHLVLNPAAPPSTTNIGRVL